MGSYSRFCGAGVTSIRRFSLLPAVPSSVSSTRMAAPGWPGVTRFNRRRCDETEPLRDPAHSPCSQSHARLAGHVATAAGGLLPHRFAPYRTPLRAGGGNPFCCGCSQDAALAGLPPLAVSWGDLVPPFGRTGSREVPLSSAPLPSDGSPICPGDIIPREWEGFKFGGLLDGAQHARCTWQRSSNRRTKNEGPIPENRALTPWAVAAESSA
jgi:hypothetical protein